MITLVGGIKLPKISVIIPVYNTEEYLARCIESVCTQTYKDFEIILIDDGSNIICHDMCDEWCKKDKRIRVYHTKNQGQASARNFGIDKAKGQFLYFLDSDDYIHFQMLEVLLGGINRYNANISACLFKRVSSCIKEKQMYYNDVKYFELDKDKIFDNWHSVEANVLWNKLFSKKVFCNIRFPEGKIYEDEYIKPQLVESVEKIVFTNTVLYYYQQRNDSTMRSTFSSKRLFKIDAIYNNILYFKKIKNREMLDKELKYFCGYYFMYIFYVMNEKDSNIDLYNYKKLYDKLFFLMLKCNEMSIKYKYMLVLYFLLPNVAEKRYGKSYRIDT